MQANDSSWFPRPSEQTALYVVPKPGEALFDEEVEALQRELFEGLTSPDAKEWKERVGVLSPADGSGKSSTRLLLSDGQVWKTDLHLYLASLEEATLWVRKKHGLGMQLGLWHPDKRWFVIQTADGYLPISVCPRLETLRQFDDWHTFLSWWTEALAWSVSLAFRDGVSLDMGPANFALDESRRRVYYIDDETYDSFSIADLAFALASRIPEHPDIPLEGWRRWGGEFSHRLKVLEDSQKEELREEIMGYPMVGRYKSARDALLEGLESGHSVELTACSSLPDLVCVFSDIHGNLPALKAVLAESKSLGAQHYLCLGDVVGYGPFPKECIRQLMELPELTILRGNHDQMVGMGGPEDGCNRLARASTEWTVSQLDEDERRWLMELPLDCSGDGWLAVHGAPKDPRRIYAYVYELNYRDNLDLLRSEGQSLCFYGHTHVQYAYILEPDGTESRSDKGSLTLGDSRTLLVNPGSVGQPRDRDTTAAFAMWDRAAGTVTFHRVAYETESVVEALSKTGLPPEIAERLEAGW